MPSSLQQDVHGKIEDYNNHLVKWGETNGISVIDIVPPFKLDTSELDDLCFDKETDSYSTLIRLEVIKLLNIIDRQCPNFNLCSNWEEVKRNINIYAAKPNEGRSTGRGNTSPPPQPPAPRAGMSARLIPARQTASPAHNSYVRSTSPRPSLVDLHPIAPIAPIAKNRGE